MSKSTCLPGTLNNASGLNGPLVECLLCRRTRNACVALSWASTAALWMTSTTMSFPPRKSGQQLLSRRPDETGLALLLRDYVPSVDLLTGLCLSAFAHWDSCRAGDIMISSTGLRSYSRPTDRQNTEHSDTHSLQLSSFRHIPQPSRE